MALGFKTSLVHHAFLRHHGCGRCVGTIEYMVIQRCELYRCMQGGCCRSSDEKRRLHASGSHFAAYLLHLVKRWGDQSADCYDVRSDFFRLVKDGLLVYHHSQVNDLETVAAEHDACDVLSNVMDVALYGRDDNLRLFASLVVSVHVWFEDAYGVSHHLGRLHDLRKEHLAISEEASDCLHASHERSLDDLQGTSVLLHRLFQVCFQGLGLAFDERVLQAVFQRCPIRSGMTAAGITGLTGIVCLSVIAGLTGNLFHQSGSLLDQPLSRLRIRVENHILDAFEKFRFDIVIHLEH